MLRNYQIAAVEEVENSNTKNVLLQMPTGAGKTFTFCELAKRFFAENIQRVLIVVHRIELLEQAKKSLGEKSFIIQAGVKQIPHNYDYYIAMVETVNKRVHLLPSFGLVIIDECHIANFRKLPFFTDECKVVGVSATPINEKPLSDVFHKLIISTDIGTLISDGFLLNCKAYGFASELVSKQNFKIRKGEFDEKQMEDFYSSEKMVKNVIESYWKFSAGKKTLIFNVNIKHNTSVYNAFLGEGLNVYHITGETPADQRKMILDAFKNQSDAILCNVGVLTTGFDEPSIHTVVLNRATKSLSLYLQMIGRGSRTYPDKTEFTVIDLGKNTLRHGFYDDPQDWQSYFQNGTKKDNNGKQGAAPIKECPTCNFTMHNRKVICPNCGHDFVEEKEKQMKEEKHQQLCLLTRDNPCIVPISQLFEVAKQRSWKPYAVLHKIVDHVLNYESKHRKIVTIEHTDSIALIELDKWCKKYEIKNNKWHKDFIKKITDEKRKSNTI